MKTWVAAKLHGITVTACNREYHGSVTIGAELMDAVDMEPYEQVHVVNLESGERWVTYALPGASGVFECNGGGALLAKPGDRCVVMTYRQSERFEGALVMQIHKTVLANIEWEMLAYRAGVEAFS